MTFLLDLIIRLLVVFGLSVALTFLLYRVLEHSQWPPLFTLADKRPAFGGLAIFGAFWLNDYLIHPFNFNDQQGVLFLASLLILITGIRDDYRPLSPLKKSMGILLASHIVYFWGGISFSSTLIAFQDPIVFHWTTYLFTIVWLYVVTNALNLLDGIDGLAASVSLVSLISLTLITLCFSLTIQLDFVTQLLFLFAAIAGFLIFNWPPAKIMLGDTGALFIGFMYASLTVTNLKFASLYSFIIPILLFAIPLFDTVFAFGRRLLNGKPVTTGDQEHIHHRLLRRGWQEPQINYLMMALSVFFSLIALALHTFPSYKRLIVGLTALIILSMIYWMIHLGTQTPSKKNPPIKRGASDKVE